MSVLATTSGFAGSFPLSSVSSLCRVALTTSYGVSTSNAPILFNTVNASTPYVNYNGSNGIFTANVTGWYLMSFSCQLGGITVSNITITNSAYFYFYVNGSQVGTGWESNGASAVPANGSGPSSLQFSFVEPMHLTAGNTFYAGFSTSFPSGVLYTGSFPGGPTSANVMLLSQDNGAQAGFISGNFQTLNSPVIVAKRTNGNDYSYNLSTNAAILFNSVTNSSPYVSYNTGTGVFTINQTGIYLISVLIELDSYPASGSPAIMLEVSNPSFFLTFSSSADSAGNNFYSFKGNFIVSFSAGATTFAQLFGSPATSVTVRGYNNSTRMSLAKIG